MAYLAVRPDGRCDIREAVTTAAGPRSRTLVSFRGALTPELLERAAARALRPFDPALLIARARDRGVPVTDRRDDRPARELLAALRAGARIDPVLVTQLRDALAALPAAPAPDALADVAEWVGASDAERGRTLRELLAVADRVLAGRPKLRERPRPRFPGIPAGAKRRRGAA
jgi:hypothetical protein